ncbi:MAG: DNA-processing protein DprA [Fimbriimonadaceae bacterium]
MKRRVYQGYDKEVNRGEITAISAVLCALYLRGNGGASCLSRRHWPKVLSTLRKDWAGLSCVNDVLRSGGFYDEADRCRDMDLLLQCLDIVEEGRCLTVLDDSYPQSWLDTLGAGAPPALWQVGSPVAPMPAWGVVGSRNLSDGQFRLAQRAGSAILSAGRVLVTGGAVGADSASIYGAVDSGGDGRISVILPYGVNLIRRHPGVTYWSVSPPSADFSTANAMERNALILRGDVRQGRWLSRHGCSVAVRGGAVDALRRHLCGVSSGLGR